MPITSTSQRKRTYSPDATRQAILDSALALFEVNGFHATSVQAIADEAEVTKGAFYHHFESKDDLVEIIHDELLDHMLREQDRILASVDGPAEQLRALIRVLVHSAARFRSHVAVYHQERRYLEHARFDAVRRKRDRLLDRTTGILRAGVADGTFRSDVDPAVATYGIDGMAVWAHHWLHAEHGDEPAHVAEALADMVLGGLRRR